MRADFNRQDQSAALSLHAEPFVPTMVTKDQFYDDFRQMNRMEVSRLQTRKTLGDYMPPSVTQSSRHHCAKKHQENMFSDNKPMFEDPRALRHVSMMHPVQQQKVGPTMADESPMYPGSYHSERMGPDHHFNYHYNQEHRPEPYFEEETILTCRVLINSWFHVMLAQITCSTIFQKMECHFIHQGCLARTI